MLKFEIWKSEYLKGAWDMRVDDGEANLYNMSKDDILWFVAQEMDNENLH